MKTFIKKHWPSLLILFLLVITAYGNALNNDFLSDDLAEIVQNPNIGNFSAIFNHTFGYIRPFIYWVIYNIFGANPIPFRALAYLFHIGGVFTLYAIVHHIYSKKSVALITASIFAVHPALTEAVIWISGGMYPQYAFFFLMSFLLYLLAKERKKYYWLSVLFYLFSFMSHPQMPLALFIIFPLYELGFGNFKKNFTKIIPFFLVFVTFIGITLMALPERSNTLQSTHYQERGMDNPLIILPVAVSSYFELIFWPQTLTLYHSELAFGPVNFGIRAVITLLFFAGILIGFKKDKHLFFWGSFFLIALSPTLTPFRLNWIVAERYLYLASVGIFVLIALGIEKITSYLKVKKLNYILLAIILSLLVVRTIIRNIDWKNEDNLWIATGKTSPSSPNTHNNLGDVYGRMGDKQKALEEFQKSVELKPNYADGYHNMGNAYRELGQLDKALESYQNALKYNPGLWQSYQNIAALYFTDKQYDLALENIQKAIQINPKNLNLYLNLGIVYLAKGDKEKAKEVFNQVLSADPGNQFAQQGLIEANQ